MPRDANTMPICSPTKNECVEKAVETVEQTAFDTTGSIGAKCACLPACTEFKFPFSMTQSELSIAKKLKLKTSLTEANPNLKNDNYVKENIAILHIYHENLHFIMQERGEVSYTSLTSHINEHACLFFFHHARFYFFQNSRFFDEHAKNVFT